MSLMYLETVYTCSTEGKFKLTMNFRCVTHIPQKKSYDTVNGLALLLTLMTLVKVEGDIGETFV